MVFVVVVCHVSYRISNGFTSLFSTFRTFDDDNVTYTVLIRWLWSCTSVESSGQMIFCMSVGSVCIGESVTVIGVFGLAAAAAVSIAAGLGAAEAGIGSCHCCW